MSLVAMNKLSKNVDNRAIGARRTRQNEKYVFRYDNKIGTKYQKSSFYKGGKLWNLLEKDVQFTETMFDFKQHVKKLYNTYIDEFHV